MLPHISQFPQFGASLISPAPISLSHVKSSFLLTAFVWHNSAMFCGFPSTGIHIWLGTQLIICIGHMFIEWEKLTSNAISPFSFLIRHSKIFNIFLTDIPVRKTGRSCLPAYNLYLLFYKYSVKSEQAATVRKHLPGIARNGTQFITPLNQKSFLPFFYIFITIQ